MGYVGNEPTAVPLDTADFNDGIITSAKIADGTIVNADINASAAIATTKFAAGNLAFPATQSASADANTLDDYEEGTWTPVIGGSGGTSGQTYSIQNGYYTKIGNRVIVNAYMTLTAKGTITSTLQLQGLPFTSSSSANNISALSLTRVHDWTLTADHVLCCAVDANSTVGTFTLYEPTGVSDSSATLSTSEVNNSTSLIIGGQYFV